MAVRRATAETITSLHDLKPGDHIKVNRLFYDHHMIVVEVLNESTVRIIHKRKEIEAVVEEDMPFTPEQITLIVYDCSYNRQEIIERARERIGEDYNLLWANCEHFATEVRTGNAVSLQVDTVSQWGIMLAVGAGIAAMATIMYGATRQRNRNSK